jgi:prophage antirepressor-like protein
MDVLAQLMPQWAVRECREHLQTFKYRDNLPPFSRVYMPSDLHENRRKIANTYVAPMRCVVDLICSLPCNPQHLIDCASSLQRHCGVNPTGDLVCRPLQSTQLSHDELLQRLGGRNIALQPSRSSQEVCASVLSTLPPEATRSTVHLFQYGSTSIHVVLDVLGEPWFRGTAVAQAMGYNDPKGILIQHVCKQRKQKREKLPMTAPLNKIEREAIWISRQGVRDLADGRGDEGERFWRWFADNVVHHVHTGGNEVPVLSALPETPVYATHEAITEELFATYKRELRHKTLECQILQIQLARFAHTTCKEFGLPMPPTLQAENLMQQAAQQELETTPDPSADELNRLQWANDRQEEMTLRLRRKIERLDLALKARRMASECGLGVSEAQLLAERQALEMAASPAHFDDGAWLTAGDYLRYARGHGEDEVQQLQTSFGKSLKAHRLQQGGALDTVTRDYRSNEVQTYIYHASRDRALLNATYQAFTLTDLYRQVVPPAAQAINNL